MPLTDIATGHRCEHYAERDACPFCAIERRADGQTGQRVTRAARRLSSAIRRAIRDAERERDTVRGYVLLGDTVSASRATSPILGAVSRAGENVGRQYYADVAGDTVERYARYIGRPDAERERVRRALTDARYAYRLGARIADSIARDSGTGRGSMGRFTVDTSDAERELTAIYRRAIRATGAAFTVATGRCPVHGRDGCPLPRFTTDADTGHRSRVADGCPMSGDGTLPRRTFTDAERELVLRTLLPERAERAPMYSQWFTGLGDTLPDVRDGHGTGHVAPYVPERDAAPLRRGTVWQRLRAVGADADTVRALRAVYDVVNVPDENGRYRVTAPWQTVADTVGVPFTSGTLQRRARRYAERMRERERRADGRQFAVDTSGTCEEIGGQPFTVPDAERTPTRARLVLRGTGRYVGRGVSDGTPVVAPIAPYAWQTVGAHLTDADTGRPLCVRGGQCADGCDALQLRAVPTRDTGAHLERPLWQNGNACGHGADGCPNTCPVRVARARRIARWDEITPDTDADTVRALVARNGRERATDAQ